MLINMSDIKRFLFSPYDDELFQYIHVHPYSYDSLLKYLKHHIYNFNCETHNGNQISMNHLKMVTFGIDFPYTNFHVYGGWLTCHCKHIKGKAAALYNQT